MIKLVDLAIIALCIYNKLPGVEITCTCKLTTKEQYIMIFKRSYMQDYIISSFLFLYDESIYYTFSQSFTVTTVTYTPYKFFAISVITYNTFLQASSVIKKKIGKNFRLLCVQ